MRNFIAAAIGLPLMFASASAPRLNGQDSASVARPETSPVAHNDSGALHLAKYRQYPWNGVNLWAGGAYETRSASHNEHFAGSLAIVGLQLSRDVWRGRRTRIAYLGEILPLMLARSGPPLNRVPDTLRNHFAQAELNRYKYRDAFGFGLAPFGAEVTYQTSRRTSALFNVTAGALWFTRIVPYGKGTQPNFTVSPGVALQWEAANRTRVALGYTFHHLSNASFGQANPGMNSQMLYVRVSRLRKPHT
ncbi:MAG: acyloxyacyl hydrolase [Gemmatimonadaceae bacterium]